MSDHRSAGVPRPLPGRRGGRGGGVLVPPAFAVAGALAILIAAAASAGCQQQQKKAPEARLTAPPLATSVEHFAGTPLSGPTTQAVPAGAGAGAIPSADALSVQVSFVALQQMPSGGDPLGAKAKLIAATRSGSPVLAAPRLTSGARVAPVDPPEGLAAAFGKGIGQTAPAGSKTGALPAGVTARFEAAEASAFADPATGRPWRRRVQIDVYRPPDRAAAGVAAAAAAGQPAGNAGRPAPLQVALVVEDLVRPESAADRDKLFAAEQSDKPTKPSKLDKPGGKASPAPKPAEPPPPPPEPPAPQRELALADMPLPPAGGSVAIAVPFQFAGTNAKAIAAVITIATGADNPAHREAVSRCADDLRNAAVVAAAEQRPAPAGGGQWAGMEVALTALDRPEHRRSALMYLAGHTGAMLCGDAVLVADEANLAGLAAAVRKAVPSGATAPTTQPAAAGDPTLAAANTPAMQAAAAAAAAGSARSADPAALGWTLDLTTLQFLGEALNAAKLPPELASVLMLHTGEAGRHAASIEQLTRGVSGRADFDGRVLGENLIFLEDSSPSSRVRAYDWLQSHGHAPAGYDPLGPTKARRAALEQMLSGPATAPAASPAGAAATRPAAAEPLPAGAAIAAHADSR